MINHDPCTTIPEDEPENEVRGLQNLSAPLARYLAASASRWHAHDEMSGSPSRFTGLHGSCQEPCLWPCFPASEKVHPWLSLRV